MAHHSVEVGLYCEECVDDPDFLDRDDYNCADWGPDRFQPNGYHSLA